VAVVVGLVLHKQVQVVLVEQAVAVLVALLMTQMVLLELQIQAVAVAVLDQQILVVHNHLEQVVLAL
jgi:hypothetical protein